MTRDEQHNWHVAINQHMWPKDGSPSRKWPDARFMYEAKTASQEVPRLMLLFKMERTDSLRKICRHCSQSPAEQVIDNHLTCCLGVKCLECPELLALDKMENAAPEAIDEAKAWTCTAHILSNGGDVSGEGYIMTVDDRMFWDRTYASLAAGNPDADMEQA